MSSRSKAQHCSLNSRWVCAGLIQIFNTNLCQNYYPVTISLPPHIPSLQLEKQGLKDTICDNMMFSDSSDLFMIELDYLVLTLYGIQPIYWYKWLHGKTGTYTKVKTNI